MTQPNIYLWLRFRYWILSKESLFMDLYPDMLLFLFSAEFSEDPIDSLTCLCDKISLLFYVNYFLKLIFIDLQV